MAEATTQLSSPWYVAGTGDGTVVSVPVTVDTANTRIRAVCHAWLTATAPVSISGLMFDLVSCGVHRQAFLTFDQSWHDATWEVPALSVIAPGSYDVHLALQNSAGNGWQIAFQILIYMVTSG